MAKFLRKLRLPSAKPSTNLAAICLMAFFIFVLGGGIYDLMEKPPRILTSPSNPVFWYPGITEQTFNESLYFTVFLLAGVSGGYLVFISTRVGLRPREAKMLLLIGAMMMLIATVYSEAILHLKLS
ncbi:MAG: hypothetical protein QXI32_05895 [Candidatus Bathyarchaeia archaeon]